MIKQVSYTCTHTMYNYIHLVCRCVYTYIVLKIPQGYGLSDIEKSLLDNKDLRLGVMASMGGFQSIGDFVRVTGVA